MIAIWIISTWELFGKPKKLMWLIGPGDGSLVKVLIEVSKRFLNLTKKKNIFI